MEAIIQSELQPPTITTYSKKSTSSHLGNNLGLVRDRISITQVPQRLTKVIFWHNEIVSPAHLL